MYYDLEDRFPRPDVCPRRNPGAPPCNCVDYAEAKAGGPVKNMQCRALENDTEAEKAAKPTQAFKSQYFKKRYNR